VFYIFPFPLAKAKFGVDERIYLLNVSALLHHTKRIEKWTINLSQHTCTGNLCVGAGTGSGRIRNYLQDPDPDPQFELRIGIRKGSIIRYLLTNLIIYLITMFIYGENHTN